MLKTLILKLLFKKEIAYIYQAKAEAIRNHDAGLHVGINICLSAFRLF